jgi:hypothetical protein
MIVIPDLKAAAINRQVSEHVNENSVIDSDNSTSYTNLKTLVNKHRPQVIKKEEAGKLLPWVYIAISNAKRIPVGYLSRY